MNYEISINTHQIIMNIIVVILGIIIGIIIGYFIFKKNIYKGPDSNLISKEVYTDIFGNKYKWIPKISVCPISYSMDKLHDPNFIDLNH